MRLWISHFFAFLLFRTKQIAAAELQEFNPFSHFRDKQDYKDDLIVVLHPRKGLGRTPLFNAMKEFAKTAPSLGRSRGLTVTHTRAGNSFFDQILQRWHIPDGQLPVGVLFPHSMENSDQGKFHLDLTPHTTVDEFQVALKGFIERYDAGKEHFHIMSQPIPAEEDQDGLALEVVGDNFESEVMDRLKANVSSIVLFYRPWCGWCRQVQPVWKKIGGKLGQNNPYLRAIKMDVDQNELMPGIHAETGAVPAIYLFKPGSPHNPVPFKAHQRTPESILEFCESQTPGLSGWLKGERPGGLESVTDGDPDKHGPDL